MPTLETNSDLTAIPVGSQKADLPRDRPSRRSDRRSRRHRQAPVREFLRKTVESGRYLAPAPHLSTVQESTLHLFRVGAGKHNDAVRMLSKL